MGGGARVAGGERSPEAPGAQTLTPLEPGAISTVLSILLPPPPLGSGVPVATRGASLPIAGALWAAPRERAVVWPGYVRRAETPRAGRPRSAALQPRAPPPSLRSLRCFPLPFLQTLLPFPRQQNLGPDCSSEIKGGQGPVEGGAGVSVVCFSGLQAIAV